MRMKSKIVIGVLMFLTSYLTYAQDESQRILREQEQQRNNWYWHQMEQGAASSQQQLPPSPPKPSGEWIKTWGAVANGSNGEGGVSIGKITESDAKADAVFQCKRGGGIDCAPSYSYYNQCIALTATSGGTAGSIDRASKLATDLCEKNGGSSCEIVYSACSEPYFKSYK